MFSSFNRRKPYMYLDIFRRRRRRRNIYGTNKSTRDISRT
jgi:hypothetical protein